MFDNEEERLYLQMMQENITRMATNSANAKAWLVTIVAGFLAIGCSISDFDYWLLLAIAPIAVFWYLDAYYLNLERGLRNREQRFINIVKNVTLADEEDSTDKTKETALFDFKTLSKTKDDKNKELGYVETGLCGLFFNSSVWPVYVIMMFIVLIVTGVINHWFAGWALCCCQ
ncbi:MAG: hypothetical protein ACI30L_02970 [Muribaculaceae bacterium]